MLFGNPKRTALLLLPFLFLAAGCGGASNPGALAEAPPSFSSPTVLVPEASGEEVFDVSPMHLDISHTDMGYLMVFNQSGEATVNFQLLDPDMVTYSYFISPGDYAVIPFSGGSGKYIMLGYVQITGNQYAALFSREMTVRLQNEFYPYLFPNQYVNFTPDSEACRLALSMMEPGTVDTEALSLIYNYVVEHVTYDDYKAATVDAGYLPDVDETLETGKGICFDYAALISAMLRSRNIPCKLQIGYAGATKHAWIDVYILSKGWINKAIAFDGESWTRLDPTFDSNADESNQDAILSYIGDGTNYNVQFTR